MKLLNEKFKLNFEKRLNDYKEKLDTIPEEDICEVNPQIGTPIIDKLSYSINDEIADLFTSLLTRASSLKTVNLAHPCFVQLIERLSVDEARLIKHLKNKDFIPCISVRAHFKDPKRGFIEELKQGTSLQTELELLFPQNISMYLDNLTSMGVLDIPPGLYKVDDYLYDPLYEQYNFEEIHERYSGSNFFSKVEEKRSYYQITDFGKSFVEACSFEKIKKPSQ